MNRRSFIETTGKGAAAALAASLLHSNAPEDAHAQTTTGKPNFIIFLADDAGWRDVGWHDSEIKTPVLDRLAAEGVTLNQFYVYPVCSPTRAALMTGRPPSRFGINGPLQYRDGRGIPPGTVTIAGLLQSRGYDTCISGKWHLGMEPQFIPNNYGFRHSYGYVGPWIDSYTHMTTDFRESMEGIRQWHRNGELIDEPGHVTDLIADEAIRFLADIRDTSKPFFLYVPFSAPHTPIQEESRWLAPYENTIENTSRRYYAASITHMDDAIGRIIAEVEKQHLGDSTVIIFMSDNGGAKGGVYTNWLVPPAKFNMSYGATDSLGDNRPFRGWKGELYEGGIRVPAFIRWPKRFQAGVCDAPLHVCDMLPTLAALAGATPPKEASVEGVDVLSAIEGKPLRENRVFYWRTGGQYAVRKGDWKMIHKGRKIDEGPDELYNIAQDPYEMHDMSLIYRTQLEDLQHELARQASSDM